MHGGLLPEDAQPRCPIKDLDMSGLALVLEKIVILRFHVVQLIEKSQRGIKSWRIAAFLCHWKMLLLFKALKTAQDRDKRHECLQPVQLLDVDIHRGVGVFPTTIPYHYTCCDIWVLTCSSLRFRSLNCLKSKWSSSPVSSTTIGAPVPCIYQTEQITSTWQYPFRNNPARLEIQGEVTGRVRKWVYFLITSLYKYFLKQGVKLSLTNDLITRAPLTAKWGNALLGILDQLSSWSLTE